MTTTNGQSGIRALTLEQLQVSGTESQAQRRKHFDKTALDELAKSIKEVGLLTPIIARPVNGHFEIVAGERRMIAAKAAGLAAISVDVRALTDEQVTKIQLVENLQREGLHPLAEAEGYEKLQSYGHSGEEIADMLGKSRAYVYGRVKLLALGPAAREAFYRGELTASTALLLARIPVVSIQRDACGKITHDFRDGIMSFRDARDLIEREYMLRLGDAPFPTGDAELLPKAGTCGACPKRTGNQAELFADVKSADVCTDPVCFKLKREAWAKARLAQAKADGQTVITGADAKKIAGHGHVSNGYAMLDERCWDDPKNRTYKQILGKGAKTELLQMPGTGDIVPVVERSAVVKKLKADGVIKPISRSSSTGSASSNKRDDKFEEAYRLAMFKAILDKAPARLGRHEIEACALALFNTGYGDDEPLFELLGWEVKNAAFGKGQKYFVEKIKAATDAMLVKIICTLLYRDELESRVDAAPVLTGEAKRLGIDTTKIKAAVKADLAAPAPAKPAKKAKAKKK